MASSQPLPARFAVSVETRYINEQVMQAAGIFSEDMAKLDVPVNSIMEPKLYQLYLVDLAGS
ncbi:MAG: hypothetical protein R3F47_18990 [Gammaproteobacteria bacterium]